MAARPRARPVRVGRGRTRGTVVNFLATRSSSPAGATRANPQSGEKLRLQTRHDGRAPGRRALRARGLNLVKESNSSMSAPSYRSEIQGLRAVAALLVAAYHIWFGRVSGGVDVFIVVSAFLITTALLKQVETGGRVQFGMFWGGLVRRLVPAASLRSDRGDRRRDTLCCRVQLWIDAIESVAASAAYVRLAAGVSGRSTTSRKVQGQVRCSTTGRSPFQGQLYVLGQGSSRPSSASRRLHGPRVGELLSLDSEPCSPSPGVLDPGHPPRINRSRYFTHVCTARGSSHWGRCCHLASTHSTSVRAATVGQVGWASRHRSCGASVSCRLSVPGYAAPCRPSEQRC